MSTNKSAQLEAFKSELRNIINGLYEIESCIRSEFKNIGNTRCADSINSVIKKYEAALSTLNSISYGTLEKLSSDT